MPTQNNTDTIKVVLVEDDTFLSKMYVDKLTRAGGFEVVSVESGQKALEIIKQEKPIHNMGGWESCQRIYFC